MISRRCLLQEQGKEFKALEADPEEYSSLLSGAGLPKEMLQVMLSMFAAIEAGEYAEVSAEVSRITEHASVPASDYVKRLDNKKV
ncbi:hypothetical protein SAMN04487969_109103 [Paenibacillus algorifonticola]|uniref:Uncharacterized protein n=1 Tax=Paenibacillus algorifonticola TaxID=684063 RepID=A0A1I2EHI9_9BACL|nr:hypothetical protein [Paenibacillus algorifonticola]SFE91996.1 hypothetical protein SAMN04487969_109103 [Paenibacillus algorifonticola]